MAQLTGLTVLRDGAVTDSALAGHPGEEQIREGLSAMNDGHHRQAIDLIMDGLELYAEHTGVTLPYD